MEVAGCALRKTALEEGVGPGKLEGTEFQEGGEEREGGVRGGEGKPIVSSYGIALMMHSGFILFAPRVPKKTTK